MLTARQIMTDQVITISADAQIDQAIEVLLTNKISGLPVTDQQGQLIGILTEFALLAIAYDSHIRCDKVSDHMTTNLFTVDINAPISTVADLCISHRVRRVPVVDEGRLVGLIARRDVLRAICECKVPVCSA